MFIFDQNFAGVAQLVEHNLAKVGVADSSSVSRSRKGRIFPAFFNCRLLNGDDKNTKSLQLFSLMS